MAVLFKHSALPLRCERIASIVEPRARVSFAQWLPDNIKLVDGPNAGEFWKASGAPYLLEIADCLSDDHPCNEVTVRKSQQTGASILALAWCLYIADLEPANTLYAAPGIEFLRDLHNAKFQPMLESWQKHIRRDVFLAQVSRSSVGSTTFEKVFPGGRLWLANAHSVTDLSGKTAKKGVRDEFSKWQNIPGYGDPNTLFKGRFTAFRRSRNYKILNISTPEVDTGDPAMDGHCRISASFERSDQRYWHCACPECSKLFVHRFERFRVNAKHPHKSYFECWCGHHISETERVVAVRDGRWIAAIDSDVESEEAGDEIVPVRRDPGFHIDAFMSMMMTYGDIADDYLESRKSETARKDFSTLDLGLPYRYRGDAPDHMRLFERREEYKRGQIPPQALILTIAADVQMRGIYYEVLAHAPNRETWVVDVGYIDGSTTEHDAGAFVELHKLWEREWPAAYGKRRRFDEFGIDANYHTGAVLTWARGHPGVKALQGRDGWGHPPLGVATDQDIDYRGRRIKGGAKLRGVGTWQLKSTLYSRLALSATAEGSAIAYPDGYCHFGTFLDENYFKQITSECLREKIVRGRKQQVWEPTASHADNHFLDCRVYNLALADPYLSTFTADDWARLAAERGIPEDLRTPDLFTPRAFQRTADKPGDGTSTPAPDDHFARLARLNEGIG